MSASTEAIIVLIRARLLTFAPMGGGSTLATLLGSRLYHEQAPADATYPYAVFRLLNRVESDGFSGMRESGDVEILFLDKPRVNEFAAHAAADVADQAMLDWNDVTAGIAFSRFRARDTLPPANMSPMDRDLIIVRCLYPVVLWPTYRTQYA